MERLSLSPLFDVLIQEPLSQLDTLTAKAYRVVHKEKPDLPCFALLCPLLPVLPRLSYLEKALVLGQDSEASRHLLLPLGAEFISLKATDWQGLAVEESDSAEQEVEENTWLALVFQDPQMSRLSMEMLKPWPEEAIYETLLPMALDALEILEKAGLTHRSLCVENLLIDFSQEQMPRVLLGEFVSTLPGFSQLSVYEPITSASAAPFARGDQTIRADLYTLGVLILTLLKGGNPWQECQTMERGFFYGGDMESDPLLARRMTMGSFNALQGRTFLSGRMTELLRALLADEVPLTIQEVREWLQGKKSLTHGQEEAIASTKVPLLFNGRRAYTAQALAASFRAHPLETCSFLQGKELFQWLEKHLYKGEMATAIESLVLQFSEENPRLLEDLFDDNPLTLVDISLVDGFITRVCQILDDERGLFVCAGLPMHIDGLRDAMKTFVLLEQPLDSFHALLEGGLLEAYEEDGVSLSERFLTENLLKDSFYTELHFYSHMSNLSCLSPLYSQPRSAYDLAQRMEDKAAFLSSEEEGFFPSLFVDRHVLAFLAGRVPSLRAVCQQGGGSKTEEEQLLNFFLLLEQLQEHVYCAPMPNMGKILTYAAVPLVARCRNLQKRNTLFQQLQHYAAQGDLGKMRRLLTGGEVLEKDRAEFQLAKMALVLIDSEIKMLENQVRYARGALMKKRAMYATISFLCTLLTSSYLFLRFWPL